MHCNAASMGTASSMNVIRSPSMHRAQGDCTVWWSWHHPGAVLRSDSRWWLTAFALRNGPVRAINALKRCINGHSIFDGCHKKPLDASRAGGCTVWGSWHHPGAVLRSDSRWWLTAFAHRNGPVRAINALQRCINGHTFRFRFRLVISRKPRAQKLS